MAKVLLSGAVRPSCMVKQVNCHKAGDQSESDRGELLAERMILGHVCRFMKNGDHFIVGMNITDQDHFNSQILRFAHASILCNVPVGHEKLLLVDMTVEPCRIIMFGKPIAEVLANAKIAVQSGLISIDLVVDGEPMAKIKEL